MVQRIWSFLIPKATGTNLEAPQSKPSHSIERTHFSNSLRSVSSSHGLISRRIEDLAITLGLAAFFSLYSLSLCCLSSSAAASSSSSDPKSSNYFKLL